MKIGHIKKNIKVFGSKILYNYGVLEAYLKLKSNSSALILAYHRVNSKEYLKNNTVMPGMYVSDDMFRLHLEWLGKNYQIVKLSYLIELVNNKEKWQKPLCVLTFDDGWYDNYEFALPLLKEYNVPATIFVVGNEIGTYKLNCFDLCFEIIQLSHNLPKQLTGIKSIDYALALNMKNRTEKARRTIKEIRCLPLAEFKQVYSKLQHYCETSLDPTHIASKYRKLSWKNMHEMQDYGVEFGYHSTNHYMLNKIPECDINKELMIPYEEAKQYEVTIKKLFCYPDGQYNTDIVRGLEELGYDGATTLDCGFNDNNINPYKLKRYNIHKGCGETLGEFLLMILSS